MRGDFSRNTFDLLHQFSRVMMQQGRVQLDADFNEQTAILLHLLQAITQDLVGEHGGPCDGCAFHLQPRTGSDYQIGAGRYYVNGVLVEVQEPISYAEHLKKNGLPEKKESLASGTLLFVDVWERLLTSAQAEGIREVALGGPDTAARAQVVWQIGEYKGNEGEFKAWLKRQDDERGKLAAWCQEPPYKPGDDPCIIPSSNRYRGLENQLYRVEIHTGGAPGEATFKWSRDNGSVIYPIIKKEGDFVFVESLGRDDRLSLKENDLVELTDDPYDLSGPQVKEARTLLRVLEVHPDGRVKLETNQDIPDYPKGDPEKLRPLLRRWDHTPSVDDKGKPSEDGGIHIVEGESVELENGIQVKFTGSIFERGDYWLIPARTITGDIEWPQKYYIGSGPEGYVPRNLPPHGPIHAYAPIALVNADNNMVDLRRKFEPLSKPYGQWKDTCLDPVSDKALEADSKPARQPRPGKTTGKGRAK